MTSINKGTLLILLSLISVFNLIHIISMEQGLRTILLFSLAVATVFYMLSKKYITEDINAT